MATQLFFNGAEIAMSSGIVHDTYALIQRVQNIDVNYSIPRTNVQVLGRMKPLNDRPVLNYTPVSLAVSYTKGNKDVERCLGLLNSTGLLVQIGQNTEVTNWGARSFRVYNAPLNSTTYAGQWNILTGILTSFSLGGTVGGVVEGSFSAEAFDMQQVANNSAKTVPSYSGQVIKSENIVITGMDFTGFGYSGLTVQSFNFGVNIGHASTFKLGTKYPERRITDGSASLQIMGFMEGTTNTVTSLSGYDPGTYITGIYALTLQPSCGSVSEPATTITLTNPYLERQSFGARVGSYVQVTLDFAVPLTTVSAEALVGSNCTIT